MKRLLPLLLLLGCAVQRAPAKEAPRSTTTTTGDTESAPTGAPVPGGADKAGSTAPPPSMPTAGAGGMVVSPEVQKAQVSVDNAANAFAAAGNDCAQLCKALSSMTNATDHLCELAGDDKRCSDAKTRLDAARAKVKSTCGTC